METVVRVLIAFGTIILVPELAKRSNTLGPLVVSLPLTSIGALLALMTTKESTPDFIASFGMGIFYFVIPSLILFPIFAGAIRYLHWAPLPALLFSCACTMTAYAGVNYWQQ